MAHAHADRNDRRRKHVEVKARDSPARHVNHQREPRPAEQLAVQINNDDHIDQRVVRLDELQRVVRP